MTALRAFLTSPLAAGGLAALLLSLVIWFVFPLIPIGEPRLFDSPVARLIAIAVVVVLWLGFVAFAAWRRRRRNAGMIAAMSAPDPSRAAIDAEGERLRAKFAEALADLKKLRFKSRFGGARYVYELPWYVFIGPPAAGKTTALLNCGLDFPLKRGERIVLEGAAGTRDCDWMFTDQAVFIDTAGRYVTQDSDAAVDRSAWTTFLDLLRRHRPAEPLNGVIVAISLADLATGDAAMLERHALAIRRGLIEIADRMGARVPVYVMVTKLDLLTGFNEFFQSLDRPAREGVWGFTFPLEGPADARTKAAADLATVEEEFDLLLARLGEAQFARLQAEADLATRARIFGFPSQFSSLRPVLGRFLREVFAPDKYSDPLLLRGLYFTSATQEGQPIDRLIGSMSREFGLSPQATGVLAPQSGRAYFLRGLLDGVVFPESGLVGRGKRAAAANAGRWAALAAAVLAPIVLGAGFWTVHRAGQAETQALIGALAAYQGDMLALEPERVGDSALERVSPTLDALRAERDRLASASPPLLGLGVADYHALTAQADAAYAKALDDLFRPRLLYRLERVMDRRIDEPGPLYEALKTYLMLGGRGGDFDPDFLRSMLRRDWEERYDRTVQADLLAGFDRHLDGLIDAMQAGLIRQRSLNETQIEVARATAKNVSNAARALNILLGQEKVRALPGWSATDTRAGGRVADQVLLRASGRDVAETIPGIYTHAGFHRVFLPNAAAAVDAALGEYWVLAEAATPPDRAEVEATRRQIRDLYFEAYVAEWRGFLDDLRIVPFRDAAHATEVLRTLTSGGSPLRGVLQDIARQTALTTPPEGVTAPVILGLGGAVGAAGAFAAMSGPADPSEGEPVARAFTDLREFVGTAADGSPLEAVILRLSELRSMASDLSDRRVGDLSALSASPAALELSRAVDTAPAEVRRMAAEMLDSFTATVAGGLRAQMSEVWSATVAPVCRARLAGNYPFGAGDEVPLGEVTDILGPGGLIDRFFADRLAPHVDTGQPQWRWRGMGLALGIPPDRLAFFQQAAALRDAFFPAAGPRPDVGMGVFQLSATPSVKSARFEIGGQQAEFRQGERNATRMNWPGLVPENGAEALLNVDTGARDITGAALPASTLRVGEIGPWGLFRLMDRYEFKTLGAGDRVQVGVSAGGERIVIELRMESATNPFALRNEIKGFTCPATL